MRRRRDRELVDRSRAGDLEAFDELVTEYRGRMYAMVYAMVRNEQDAWDIAQEGFVKAWRSLGRFSGQAAFSTWLHRIMANTAIDWMRRRARRPEAEFDEALAAEGTGTSGESATPSDEAVRRELGERIEEAMGRLSPDHRAVVVLREVQGLSYHEMAEALGCSEGTVMSRLYYARKALRKSLGDLYERL